MLNLGTLWDLQYSKANLSREERESKKFLDFKSQIGAARFMLGYFVSQNTVIPKWRPTDDRLAVVQEVDSYPHDLQGLDNSFWASTWNMMLTPKAYLLINMQTDIRGFKYKIYKRDRLVCMHNKNAFLSFPPFFLCCYSFFSTKCQTYCESYLLKVAFQLNYICKL